MSNRYEVVGKNIFVEEIDKEDYLENQVFGLTVVKIGIYKSSESFIESEFSLRVYNDGTIMISDASAGCVIIDDSMFPALEKVISVAKEQIGELKWIKK